MMNNIKIYKLKVIKSSEGSIIKFINKKSEYFMKFGEVYFSTVNYNTEKKWRYHHKMHLNIFVLKGKIKFYFYDKDKKIKNLPKYLTCSEKDPVCLSIPPKIWFKFKGIGKKENTLINFSNILHSDNEYKLSDDLRYEE